MDGSGWQLQTPQINLNDTEKETARLHVPPDRRAHHHPWRGLAKNIEPTSGQASEATTSSQETQGMGEY